MKPRAFRPLRTTATWAVFASIVATGLVAPTPSRRDAVHVALESLELARTAAAGWTATISRPAGTDMLGFSWEGSEPGAVELRVNGGRWLRLESDADEGPDPGSREDHGRVAAGPVWLGPSPKPVQLRVVEGALPRLRVHALNTGALDRAGWQMPSAAADPPRAGGLSRARWGADESARTCPPEYAPRVQMAILHHTVTANEYRPEDVPAIIRGIATFHIKVNGWCDLGYNFIVDRFGRVWEGRYGGVDRPVIGAHASGFNKGTTGIAVLGDFSQTPAPPAVTDGVRRLLTWKLARSGVDPRALTQIGGRTLPTVLGHRDVNATACPGSIEDLLPSLRMDVQERIMQSVPYPAAGWSPTAGAPSLLTLDARGGLHPAGGQAAVSHTWHSATGTSARGAVRQGTGGYVVEADGSLHPFGGAPAVIPSALWPGRDVARGVVSGPNPGSGWVLAGAGSLHHFGAAPIVLNGPSWPGQDVARAAVSLKGGLGGYVLDAKGGIHPFGVATPVTGITGYWRDGDIARAIGLRPDGRSGYVLDRSGALHQFGGAPPLRASAYWAGQDIARGLVLTPAGDGGWVLDIDGFAWPFGSARAVPLSMTWAGLGIARAIV